MAIGPDGAVYLADPTQHYVERIDLATGVLSLAAGIGTASAAPVVPGPRQQVEVSPSAIAVAPTLDLYLTDPRSDRVLTIASTRVPTRLTVESVSVYGADCFALIARYTPKAGFSLSERLDSGPVRYYPTAWADDRVGVGWCGVDPRIPHTLVLTADNGAALSTTIAVIPAAPPPPPRGPSWFADPLNAKQRAALAPIPRSPRAVTGPARRTRALHRTSTDALAVPAATARGHQLFRGQSVVLEARALFTANGSRLTPTGRSTLATLGASLTGAQAITCEAYTDYARSGRTATGRTRARASAVCAAVRASLTVPPRTTALGMGGSRPVVIGGRAANRTANDRVVVTVTSAGRTLRGPVPI
jgi:outer membrane protein OmpA-like peptidoglycan-associated protein